MLFYGGEKIKLYRKHGDAQTVIAKADFTGGLNTAAQVDGKKFSVSSASNGDLITYDAAKNTFVNKTKSAALADYVLKTELLPYAKTAEVATSLASYAVESEVAVSLSSYVTKESLASSLENYVSESEVAASLSGFAKAETLSAYAKKSEVANTYDFVSEDNGTSGGDSWHSKKKQINLQILSR